MESRYDRNAVYKTYLRDRRKKMRPEQIGIYASSGYGKSLAEEGMVQTYYEDGCVCIYLGDGMKGEEEGAFAMFEPKARYHLELIEGRVKRPISKANVKLYHPFSFGLPKTKSPNYNIFTIPIKSLNRREFSMLAETQSDSDTIRILIQASRNLSKKSGIYQLLHDIQDLVRKSDKKNDNKKHDPKNFFLSVTAGTAKNMQEIANIFQPFKREYFLSEDECDYNLDFSKILSDNKKIHFFSTKYMKDPKMKQFLILLILNKLIENKKYAKYPVLIVIPEIRKHCPDKAQGYQKFLSRAITEALSTMRNIGRGYSSILSSQSWNDTSQEIRDSHTMTYLGKLNLNDIDKLSKIMGYKRTMKENLADPLPNSWYKVGEENIQRFLLVPSWGHAEPEYNFENMFQKYYPEKMIYFKDIISNMKEKLSQEEKIFKDIATKEIEKFKEDKKKLEIEKQEKQKEKIIKEEAKRLRAEEKQKKKILAHQMKDEQGMNISQISATLNTSRATIYRWLGEPLVKDEENV